jgi:two-component system NtrC family sensor kinase
VNTEDRHDTSCPELPARRRGTTIVSDTQSILIVDDQVANLNLLTDILKGHGYKVRPAPSGRLALEAARHTPPDLVLLDINMPEMNGYEVCRIFKATPGLEAIPILFISALGDVGDKVRAFQEGGQDYITKPFQVEEVLARVKLHLELQRMRTELEERNAALEDALDRLKKTQSHLILSEKMAALGVMAAGVAHEINNPVNFVKTSCHSLHNDMLDLLDLTAFCAELIPPERQAALDAHKRRLDHETLLREIPELFANIEQGLQRTEDIVKSLRIFARTDEAVSEGIDPRAIMDSVLVMLRSRYKNRARIVKNYGAPPLVSGNAGKLSQIFINILSNAVDAVEAMGETEGVITITAETEIRDGRPHAALRIADTGPGIEPGAIRRIFDPFYTTKPVGKGTGLGLFICSNLVAEHHGFIEVENQAGSGTTFSILLPASQEGSCPAPSPT